MAKAEETLTTEVDASGAKQPEASKPRTLVEIISSQLAALRIHHQSVLDTESVEAVHKMRVTTRRLQASLDLLAREMKVRKRKRLLRGWRRRLSSIRNYDVFLELVEKEAPSRGRTRRQQLELVKASLQGKRLERSAKVKHFLQRINLDKIIPELGSMTPPPGKTPDPHNPVDGAPNEPSVRAPETETLAINEQRVAGYAAERLDQRLAEFLALAELSHPTNNPAELHQLRIAAKRVRYLLEIVTEMGYGNAAHALLWLRTLQDRIGDWHDLEALEEEIMAIVSSTDFMKQHLAESSQMLLAAAHLQKKKETLVLRLFPVRVPKYVELTSQRIARSLRRHSFRNKAPRRPPTA
jgi:CHAD domain-containing protein